VGKTEFTSEHPSVRLRQARRAGDVEYIVEVLRTSTDVSDRRTAARFLGLIGDMQAVRPLIRALDASDVLLQNLAVKALGRIGDPSAIPALFQVATSADSPGVRFTAASVLADLGDSRGSDLILQLLLCDATARSTQQRDALPKTSVRHWRRWAGERLVQLRATDAIPKLEAVAATAGFRERRRLTRLIRRLRALA
jgi:HEAT repeat protein